jgi:hypothetical protein
MPAAAMCRLPIGPRVLVFSLLASAFQVELSKFFGRLAILVTLQKLDERAFLGQAEWFIAVRPHFPKKVKADEHCFE